MRIVARLLIVLALLGTARSRLLVAQGPGALHIVKVATYGWPDLPPTAGSLSAQSNRLQGGLLGSINGAVEGRDGSIFALALVNKKVAVFDQKGTFTRAFGGAGEGPGEFRRPTRICVGSDGSIYVWDPGLRRLTRFAPDGREVSQTAVLAATITDFSVAGDRAWFVRSVISNGAAVLGVDLKTGAVVDSFATLSKDEASISGFGAPGSITSNKAGDVIFAGPFPVNLRIWTNHAVRAVGSNRFPDTRGITAKSGTRLVPVSMRGFTVRADGTYGALYSTSAISDDGAIGSSHYWLELLRADGTSLGRTELAGVDFATGISSAANGDLLVGVVSDYPQVWRLRPSPAGH